jgi:AAA15 family ATPase/GTPase
VNKKNDIETNYNQEKKVMANAISRIELENFLVFKGEFSADFCPGVNVLIGSNGSGKTTLLKCLYWACEFSNKSVFEQHTGNLQLNRNAETPYRTIFSLSDYFMVPQADNGGNKYFNSTIRLYSNAISDKDPVLEVSVPDNLSTIQLRDIGVNRPKNIALAQWCKQKIQSVFIPVTEMLQHSKGFLALERERKIPFDKTQIDILSKAELGETHEITLNASKLLDEIKSVIMGEVIYENDTFFIVKTDGRNVPFSLEASGFQKFGLLWKLLRNGLLESGSILFWDEPEASINPELIPALVDILLELQNGGVQIFIATHSYDVARWFELNKKTENSLRYFNLCKTDSGIAADVADDYVSLQNSLIEDAGDMLLRRVTKVAAEKAGVILK